MVGILVNAYAVRQSGYAISRVIFHLTVKRRGKRMKELTLNEAGNLEWDSADLEMLFIEDHPEEIEAIIHAAHQNAIRQVVEWGGSWCDDEEHMERLNRIDPCYKRKCNICWQEAEKCLRNACDIPDLKPRSCPYCLPLNTYPKYFTPPDKPDKGN